MRFRNLTTAAAAVLVVMAFPATACAAAAAPAVTVAATPSTPATASKSATRTYDLDFTLPTIGKSGCLVCHGDANLAKIGPDATSTIFVEIEKLRQSAHAKDTPCTGCHLDFAYTSPHTQSAPGEDWQRAARLACKNCHAKEFTEYANGAHSLAGEAGVKAAATAKRRKAEGKPARVPLCGDCHGGHEIPSKDDTAAMAVQQGSGLKMCGQCHEREADSYDDYYHGSAYRTGSADAPSCWDCHGYHEMIPSTDRRSPVHESNLVRTCGQGDCHEDVDEEFLDYAELIHGQKKIVEANPVVAVVSNAKRAISDVFAALGALF